VKRLGVKNAAEDDFARLEAELQPAAVQAALLADDAGPPDCAETQQRAPSDGEAASPG
jgi:hypothetical protein